MCRLSPLVFVVVVAVLVVTKTGAQSEWLVPPDSIVLDGIPKIPASLEKVTDGFKDVFNDLLIAWDPVKPEPVILRKGYSTWLVGQVKSPGQVPRYLAGIAPRTYGVYGHPQGKYLLVRADTPGNEHYQLYRSDVGTQALTLLTDGKSTNLYPILSNSGEWLMYSSNRRNGKDLDVYMINPLDPRSDRMAAKLEGEDWAAFDWSPDDKRVILSELISKNETYLWVLDVDTGAKNLVTPAVSRERVFNGSHAQFSRDGKGIYLITDRDSEFQRLAYLDLETKRYRYLTSQIKWDVEEFLLSPDRTNLAFTTNEDGISRLHLLDTTTRKEKPIPGPRGVISNLTWHANGSLLGFDLSSATAPSSVYAIDLKDGKLQRWTHCDAPGLNSREMTEPESVRWTSFDGKQISGFLYRPPNKFRGKRPVIIDIHGGPDSQFRPEFRVEDSYFATELGIVTIFPNIRGSSGYGKTFLKLDDGSLRANCVKDIGALLDWIRTQADLDADRVMVRGGSYGGYVTLSVAATYGDKICGAIALAAQSNLRTLLQTADKWNLDRWRQEYGDDRDITMRTLLEKISPLNNVQRITKPILITHGRLDARVPVSEAEQMVWALRKQQTRVWYLLARNDGHSFNNSATKDFVFFSQVLFIQTYLVASN